MSSLRLIPPALTEFQKYANYPNAAWATRVICYPLGAHVARLLGSIGISPNQTSVMGLFIAIIPVIYAMFASHAPWLEAVGLFLGLQLAYILDCADGVLARAMNCSSAFGSILDKLCDGFQTLCIPLLLLHSEASNPNCQWTMEQITLLAAGFAASSSLLTHSIWLNNVQPKPQHEAPRKRSILHSTTTFLIDSPTMRLAICVAWAWGIFIPFMLGLAVFNFVVFAAYLRRIYHQPA